MWQSIKDLYTAYRKINADRYHAKNVIKLTTHMLKENIQRFNDLKECKRILSKHYGLFPIEGRQNVQTVLDMMTFGYTIKDEKIYFSSLWDKGIINDIENYVELIAARLSNMKRLYKECHYEDVEKIYKSIMEEEGRITNKITNKII